MTCLTCGSETVMGRCRPCRQTAALCRCAPVVVVPRWLQLARRREHGLAKDLGASGMTTRDFALFILAVVVAFGAGLWGASR